MGLGTLFNEGLVELEGTRVSLASGTTEAPAPATRAVAHGLYLGRFGAALARRRIATAGVTMRTFPKRALE